MTASELRELAQRLCEVEPHDYEDRAITEAAAEVLELVAWAEENKVEAVRRRHGYSVHVGLVAHNSDTLIDTLRRAREAAR